MVKMKKISKSILLLLLLLSLALCVAALFTGCSSSDENKTVTSESTGVTTTVGTVTTTAVTTESTMTSVVTSAEQYTTEEIVEEEIGAGILDGPSADEGNGAAKLAAVGASSGIMANEYRYFMTSYRRQLLDEAQIVDTDEAAIGFWSAVDASGKNRADIATGLIMNELRELKVIEQVAAAKGLSLDEDEIANLATETLMNIDSYGGGDAFSQLLSEYGVSVSDYYKILQLTAVRDKLLTSERDSITISESDAKAYYDSNPDTYSDVVTIHQVLLLLEGDDLEHIRTDEETRALADSVLVRVNAGEDIALLAEELSEAPNAAETGGLMTVTKVDESLPPEVIDWVFAADVSDTAVVETAFGFYVLRIEDRHQQPFESVQDQITDVLKDTRIAERISEWTGDPQYKMTVDEEALAAASQAFN